MRAFFLPLVTNLFLLFTFSPVEAVQNSNYDALNWLNGQIYFCMPLEEFIQVMQVHRLASQLEPSESSLSEERNNPNILQYKSKTINLQFCGANFHPNFKFVKNNGVFRLYQVEGSILTNTANMLVLANQLYGTPVKLLQLPHSQDLEWTIGKNIPVKVIYSETDPSKIRDPNILRWIRNWEISRTIMMYSSSPQDIHAYLHALTNQNNY